MKKNWEIFLIGLVLFIVGSLKLPSTFSAPIDVSCVFFATGALVMAIALKE